MALKRMMAALIAAAILIPAVHAGASGPPELSAASAILIDGESGRVLFEKNSRQERSIASITKLMTALVAVERMESLQEEVVIQREWTGIEGSSLYLKPGEKVTLELLLYGLLLHSGNDAAVSIASYCAGNVDAFVDIMNEQAAQLGMEQTHFANPNGLSEDGHYSTAYDMALLGRACMGNEMVAEIVGTKSITLGNRTLTNHNKLLWRCEGCVGMKTGYTESSGRTLVSAAQRDGLTLIAVTLAAPDDWNDHEKLYDYGFDLCYRQLLCAEGEAAGQVPAAGGLVPFVTAVTAEELNYPLMEGEELSVKYDLPECVDAPVGDKAVLGRLSFYLNGALIGETDLLAKSAVHCDLWEPKGFFQRMKMRFGI